MSVKIRLARRGRKKQPFYHIVVADARAPRDGKFIEQIGSYNPMTKPATIDLDRDKAFDWLMKGAQPTDTVRAMLRFKGVLYRKHLSRGVAKGAMTEEKAAELYQAFIDAKETKVAARFEETRKEKLAFYVALSGKPGKVEQEVTAATEELAEFQEPAESGLEMAAEAPAPETKEEAPAPVKEEVKEAAPAPEVKEEAPVAAEETVAPDDLTKIEGIGPAISKVLQSNGIPTFSVLAAADADKIKEILTSAEGNFGMHDPATWPKQADMAAKGEWDVLKKWQDELDGGKVVEAKSEEE